MCFLLAGLPKHLLTWWPYWLSLSLEGDSWGRNLQINTHLSIPWWELACRQEIIHKVLLPWTCEGFISSALKCPTLLIPWLSTHTVLPFLSSSGYTPGWWQLLSSKHKDTGISELCLPLALPSLQNCPYAPAESLVLLPGELDQGSCQAWEMLPSRMKRKPLQQLSAFLMITDLSSCLHNQDIIYVLKLIKRSRCPGIGKHHSIFSLLFWTFWAWNFNHSLNFAEF